MADKEHITVNSLPSAAVMHRKVDELYSEHKFVTFEWRIGPDRSIGQNSLLHLWLTEYAAHLLNKPKKQVTKGELEGIKRVAKREYYLATGYAHMVHEVVNPFNPEQKKRDYTSSADWKQGEMFAFLNWLQMKAAGDGLILESLGEHAKLQRQQEAA